MDSFDPRKYGSSVAELLADERLCALGPGQPNPTAHDQLSRLSAEQLFPEVRDREMADCCLAGLWLWHDFLDESHAISQRIASPSGSYWHGIMHRREPDYSNSKYWYRRVGEHAIFPALRDAAAARAATNEPVQQAAYLTSQASWDPFSFVDLCAAAANGLADCELLCREIARDEWRLLFDHCYQEAVGG